MFKFITKKYIMHRWRQNDKQIIRMERLRNINNVTIEKSTDKALNDILARAYTRSLIYFELLKIL